MVVVVGSDRFVRSHRSEFGLWIRLASLNGRPECQNTSSCHLGGYLKPSEASQGAWERETRCVKASLAQVFKRAFILWSCKS